MGAPVVGNAYAYSACYQLAIAAGVLLTIFTLVRRRSMSAEWLLLLAACLVAGVVGSKLATLPLREVLDGARHTGLLPQTTRKSFLGAVFGGLIGICIARRCLGFRTSVLDVLAIPLLISLAVGRVGCFLTGCCFGTVTHLPWAVRYAAGTPAHDTHVRQGLIGPEALASLTVHPTQLYEVCLALCIAAALWLVQRRLRAPGSVFQAAVVLYGACRFVGEFTREGAPSYWILKPAQWSLLCVVAVSTAILVCRERRGWHQQRASRPDLGGLHRNLLCACGTVATVIVARHWFTALERSVLGVIAVVAVAAVGRHVLSYALRARWMPALASGTVFLTLAVGTGWQPYARAEPDDTGYWTIGTNAGQGRYFDESCGGRTFYSYSAYGPELSHTDGLGGENALTLGLRTTQIVREEEESGGEHHAPETRTSVNLYARYDSEFVGLGFGFRAFDNVLDIAQPSLALRLGDARRIFVESRMNTDTDLARGMPFRLGIGAALREGHPGHVAVGVYTNDDGGGWYLNPHLVIADRWVLDPLIARGEHGIYHLGISLRLRLHYE